MRVLYWTDWFLPSIGGVEVFSARLLPELVRRGHQITVVAGHHTSGLPDLVEWDGVAVRRLPFHAVLAARDMHTTAGILREVALLKRAVRPDVVHLNTLGPSLLFHLQTTRASPGPVLLTMHSPVTVDAPRTDTLYGQGLQSANWINCNSRAVHADLCALVPALRNRSSITYYGMDAPSIPPAPRPDGAPVILGYGRLVEDKGFDVAIRAFAEVIRRIPNARLLLGGDGAAKPALEQLAADLGVSSSVEFAGALNPLQVPELINRASVVVVPSRWKEPFGLVALEAALMARPVVAARIGGLPEVVEEDRTGLLVDPDDHIALAAALEYLLTDSKAADRMGEAAQMRARERFSWARCVDTYEHLYEQVSTLDLV